MTKEGYPVIKPKELLNQGDGDPREIGRIDDIGLAEISAHAENDIRKSNGNRRLNAEEGQFVVEAEWNELGKRALNNLPIKSSKYLKVKLQQAVLEAYVEEAKNLQLGADQIARSTIDSYEHEKYDKPSKQ